MRAVLSYMLPVTLAIAAGLKLFSWEESVSFTSAVFSSSRKLSEIIVGALIIVEVVPTTLLLLKFSRFANIVAIGFMLVATGVWFAVWLRAEVPTCACFGLWSRYTLITEGAAGVFTRNALLVLPAFAFLVLDQRRSHGEANRMASAPSIHAH